MYVGLICEDGRPVAVKRVIHELYMRVDCEVETLVKLDSHPNIVKYVVIIFKYLHI